MERTKTLETLIVLALAALILGRLLQRDALLLGSGLLLALGLFPNRAADALARLWLGFSERLGKVTSRILLGAIYYLFLVPLALLARPFTAATRRYFFDREQPTLFLESRQAFDRRDFERPW